ncbi:MAG: nucleotide exchange factor GrpE [Anaerolineae bacterium]|nr:nucleotide exchange factor GrpE [Anaerolineae bacterium]
MNRAVNIPVRVVRSADRAGDPEVEKASSQPVPDGSAEKVTSGGGHPGERPSKESSVEEPTGARSAQLEAGADWQERALRLQADMENYRRRQRRLAEDQVEAERSRLLQSFLRVVDDLERALAVPSREDRGLREGILLTYRAALNILKGEGVERMHPQDEPFDPNWQEAISTVSHRQANAVPGTVVQVVEPGYQMDGRLLRPSKVVVAV